MVQGQSATDSLKETLLSNKTLIVISFAVVMIVFLLIYISSQLNLQKNNCSKLSIRPNSSVLSINNSNLDIRTGLNEYFVKTAYNCCCTGQFKNDYVDLCALKNCASNGVRALDFQIYSLNDKPIISASSVVSNKYKEMYNYIDFFDGIMSTRKWFVDDQSNVNSEDPLFLIFRLYTQNSKVYTMMGDAINHVFGYASPLSNMIYILPQNKSLDQIGLSNLIRKVVIIIDPTYGDPTSFHNSKLANYTSMVTGNSLTNHMYRESTLLSTLSVGITSGNKIDVSNNLTILYPDLQINQNNYDFVRTGMSNNITFIGMNFQYSDVFLKQYNKLFASCAFLKKSSFQK
jgi:hypothetical protein